MYARDFLVKLRETSAGAFASPGPLFWFVAAAVMAPFTLLALGGVQSNNLPWYFWALTPLVLLVIVSTGFLMFARESHHAEDISISPRQS